MRDFTRRSLQIGPPFQGGGTGSNPVGGALEIWPKFFIYKDFRVTGSNRE